MSRWHRALRAFVILTFGWGCHDVGAEFGAAGTGSRSPGAEPTQSIVLGDEELRVMPEVGVVTAATWLETGLAVLDGQGLQLRFFDGQGHLTATYGGEGYGPGEFKGPVALGGMGRDSVVVLDVVLRRLLVFSADRGFERSIPIRATSPQLQFIGRLEDGSFMLQGDDFEPRTERSWRQPATFLRVHGRSGDMDTLFVLPGKEYYRVRFAGQPVFGQVPFGAVTLVAAAGNTIVSGPGSDCEFTLYDAGGRVLGQLVPPCNGRRVTKDTRQAWADKRAAGARRAIAGDFGVALYSSGRIPFPRTAPAYDEVLVDDCGQVWLGNTNLPGDPAKFWSVFSRFGDPTGLLSLDPRASLQQVMSRRLVVIENDSLGRTAVVVRSLGRADTSGLAPPCS